MYYRHRHLIVYRSAITVYIEPPFDASSISKKSAQKLGSKQNGKTHFWRK